MLETARLVLRPPSAADFDWYLANLNSPAVMRHLGGVREPAGVSEGLAMSIESFARKGIGIWTVLRKDSSEIVGKCGLSRIDCEHAPDAIAGLPQAGWSLAEHCWGQGIAEEAARAVLEFGFNGLRLPTIHGQTSESNRSSTRLMARLGFVRCSEYDYVDTDYPASDNPTTVYRLDRSDREFA
jgi:RimJ/RimL family protein N-acetyltransferase